MLSNTTIRTRVAAAVLSTLGLLLMVAGGSEVFVAQRAARVADLVRPELTDEGLAQHRRDFETLSSVIDGLDSSVLPAVAKELRLSENELRGEITRSYPEVGQLLEQKDVLLPFAEQGLTNLERQQEDFQNADSLPPLGLPGYSGGLLNIVLGAGVFVTGLVALSRGPTRARAHLATIAFIAALMIVVPVALQVPQKAQSAQRVLDSLNPSSRVVQRTDSAFESGRDGQIALQNELLPALATALGLNPAEFQSAIRQSFPETAAGLAEMPEIIDRYEVRVAIRHDGATDLRALKRVPIGTLGWFNPAFGMLLFVAAGWVFVQRRAESSVEPDSEPMATD